MRCGSAEVVDSTMAACACGAEAAAGEEGGEWTAAAAGLYGKVNESEAEEGEAAGAEADARLSKGEATDGICTCG